MPEPSTDDFAEMIDLTDHDGLPSQEQGAALGYWEWRTDGPWFLGATNARRRRMPKM
jgi:hypothetical protein